MKSTPNHIQDSSNAATQKVAAFDFDGTLAKSDSLIPFLVRVRGKRGVAVATLKHLPQLIKMKLTNSKHGDVKQSFIADLLSGAQLNELEQHAIAHSQEIVETKLFPQTIAKLREHQQRGDFVVMISASPDIYLKHVARALGIEQLISTQLEVVDRKLTGRFVGNNVRDTEKARLLKARLSEQFGTDTPVEIWAYGNSDGDADLLQMAQHPYWVDKSGSVTGYVPSR